VKENPNRKILCQNFSNLSKHQISQILFAQQLSMQRYNLSNACWTYFTHDLFHSVEPQRFSVGDFNKETTFVSDPNENYFEIPRLSTLSE